MAAFQPSPRDRVASACASALLVAGLGWALVAGLGVRMPGAAERALETFDVLPAPPPRPPEPVVPMRRASRRPEGRAAPPALRSSATPIVAPVPVVVLPPVSPVVAAPVAGLGDAARQGAAPVPGPGQGAGGEGDGFGAGGDGDGDGGGWRDHSPPRRVRDMKRGDYPAAAAELGVEGVVAVRFAVERDGRVTGCRVTAGSGHPSLDGATCPLMEKRFRYRPSRDGDGRAVRAVVTMDFEWVLEREAAAR